MKTLRLTYQLIAIPAAFSLSTCHTQSSQQQPTPPNIIYILADDMGYGDINAFNPHSQIPTPTLDSMASAGIMFTDAHSNSSVSTPTRYGTLTGRYAFRSSLKKGVLTGYSSPPDWKRTRNNCVIPQQPRLPDRLHREMASRARLGKKGCQETPLYRQRVECREHGQCRLHRLYKRRSHRLWLRL